MFARVRRRVGERLHGGDVGRLLQQTNASCVQVLLQFVAPQAYCAVQLHPLSYSTEFNIFSQSNMHGVAAFTGNQEKERFRLQSDMSFPGSKPL